MDPKRAYIEQTMEMARDEWFKNHRAENHDFMANYGAGIPNRVGSISHIRWANPENSNYLVLYFLYGSTLFVTGDLGSAVYRWTQTPPTGFIWIANTDFSYFAEKHAGLRSGDTTTWNPDICLQRAKSYFAGQRKFRLKREWQNAAQQGREEWQRFIWDNINSLGYDAAAELSEFGLVPDNRCIGHWLGLKMAVTQLAETAGTTV
jgi:hypothetical protein